METRARYYDGVSAGARDVSVRLSGGLLAIEAEGLILQHELNRLDVRPPVGGGVYVVTLPDGASVHIDDNAFVQALDARMGKRRLVAVLERSWPWALGALATAVVATFAILTYGVPVMAREVAFSVPPDLASRLRSDGLGVLDKVLFEASELPQDTRARLQAHFAAIKATDPEFQDYSLHFRSSAAVGPNAFAVPGGLVVMTDEIVELAGNDDELIAVLAHEVGHLANRHSLRILLQNSASALLIASLTGDISNISAVSAGIPTMLMQAKYSRDFEREADEFAFQYMDANGIDSGALSRLLLRIEDRGGDVPTWMSSHPGSADRIDE